MCDRFLRNFEGTLLTYSASRWYAGFFRKPRAIYWVVKDASCSKPIKAARALPRLLQAAGHSSGRQRTLVTAVQPANRLPTMRPEGVRHGGIGSQIRVRRTQHARALQCPSSKISYAYFPYRGGAYSKSCIDSRAATVPASPRDKKVSSSSLTDRAGRVKASR